MKTEKTGMIRRFDMFGRIVIPKEIRKTLHMKEGDPVDIGVSGHSIIISKCRMLQNLENLCGKYLEAYIGTCGGSCIICSSEHVLVSKRIQFSSETLLSLAVRTYIQHMEPYQYNAGNPLDLFGDGKYTLHALYPIGTCKEQTGAVLLLHHRDTTTEQLACAKMLAAILTELTKE